MTGLPIREAARVIVVDEHGRVLLVRFDFPSGDAVWATVGGGLERGESHEDAARRELREEAGLHDVVLGPCVWTREHLFPDPIEVAGQRERYFLVRTPVFEAVPEHGWERLNAEGVTAIRWWTLEEIESARAERFAPRRLAPLLRELLRDGPPSTPRDAGV